MPKEEINLPSHHPAGWVVAHAHLSTFGALHKDMAVLAYQAHSGGLMTPHRHSLFFNHLTAFLLHFFYNPKRNVKKMQKNSKRTEGVGTYLSTSG